LVALVASGRLEASQAHARRRVIVLSDGDDSDWGKDPAARVEAIALTQFLINRLVVDAVLISLVDDNAPLWAICEFTGGLAFRPKTRGEGFRLSE
jgi:hypothetical protein